jgi:SOS-response transcriptional repressor LexA
VNGGATIKKYKKQGKNIYLLPHSSEEHHTPIILSEDDQVEAS